MSSSTHDDVCRSWACSHNYLETDSLYSSLKPKKGVCHGDCDEIESEFSTRNDLQRDVRGRMIELLNQQLADTFDLYSQAKQAHWNVKGAQFFQLHELFDRLAEELPVTST